ncbi:cyanamide hydratase [Nonomuraea sp. NPDC005650]|uniref:cyanamide hydratase n=1 Tax=Nonomuraea sp. NPDC005650 TaxID=3157045 RepID=UPI0033A954D7
MFPQTPAAAAALSVARRFYSPVLLNHCVRSYLWGAMYGAAHRTVAGWPTERAARAEKIIVLHMREDVSAATDPEAHLLQVASSWEVVGRHAGQFPAEARAEMLARYPRLGFGGDFLASFEDQARRKPGSAAAVSVRNDLATRIAANPLEGPSPA